MKYITAELTGSLLDCAVAKANGQLAWTPNALDGRLRAGILAANAETGFPELFAPSTESAHGGPIMEREHIGCYWIESESQWRAGLDMHGYTPEFNSAEVHGSTMLIAAMRAFVTVKLGEEVDL